MFESGGARRGLLGTLELECRGAPGLARALGEDSGTIRGGSVRVRAGPAMVRRAHMRAAFSEGVASGRRVDVRHRVRKLSAIKLQCIPNYLRGPVLIKLLEL